MEIATALENWHAERRKSVEVKMVITPCGIVVEYIIRKEVPAEDREAP